VEGLWWRLSICGGDGRGVVKGWHLGGGSILCRGRVGGC